MKKDFPSLCVSTQPRTHGRESGSYFHAFLCGLRVFIQMKRERARRVTAYGCARSEINNTNEYGMNKPGTATGARKRWGLRCAVSTTK